MNVSVIIPIYNVEKYAERCILSIMNQSYTEDVECIVVNDCTPDNSMKIVERLVADYKGPIQFKLLYHEHNKGVAAVRNTGLYAASGNYIIHIDSDDYCEPDMLEKMYAKAVEEDADVVVADYWETYLDKEIYKAQMLPEKRKDYVKAFIEEQMAAAVWNKMIRRDFLIKNQLMFIEGIDMGEDILLIHRLFFYVHRVVHLPMAFVHYVCYNPNSYCQSMSKKSLENFIAGEKILLDFYTKVGLRTEIYNELLKMRMRNWLLLLLRSKGEQQKEWNILYSDIKIREIVKYHPYGKGQICLLLAAMDLLPVLNFLRYIKNKILILVK